MKEVVELSTAQLRGDPTLLAQARDAGKVVRLVVRMTDVLTHIQDPYRVRPEHLRISSFTALEHADEIVLRWDGTRQRFLKNRLGPAV